MCRTWRKCGLERAYAAEGMMTLVAKAAGCCQESYRDPGSGQYPLREVVQKRQIAHHHTTITIC